MRIDQRGFGIVEILIGIVIVGLLGTVGWLVYDRQSNNGSNATTKTTQADTQKSSDDFLALADFNAQITLDDKTSGLKLGSVRPSDYNETDKTVPIIAPQLDSAWKCEANSEGNFKGSIGTISITTQAKRSGPYEPLVTKKVGNYTFGFEPGGSNCTDSPDYPQLVDAFKARFENMEAIQ